MVRRVQNTLNAVGVEAEVKAIDSALPGRRFDSLIVRLPITY